MTTAIGANFTATEVTTIVQDRDVQIVTIIITVKGGQINDQSPIIHFYEISS